jgi:hypothetical protein
MTFLTENLDILEVIFGYMTLPELVLMSEVCKVWYDVSRRGRLWRRYKTTEIVFDERNGMKDRKMESVNEKLRKELKIQGKEKL